MAPIVSSNSVETDHLIIPSPSSSSPPEYHQPSLTTAATAAALAEWSPIAKALLKENQVIPNVGSTARDHLANERTYLAWIRTSLALIAGGIGLLRWDASSDVEGYMVGVLGVVALLTSTWRYFRVMQLLEQGQFEPNVTSLLVLVIFVSVAIIIAFCSHYKHEEATTVTAA